jgi:hypothetical protein
MGKNALFSGQPIFSQIINHIPKRKLQSIVNKHNGDRYVKKFNSYHHLITMLYAEFQKCDSLREIEVGMTGVMEKINHLGVSHLPKKSTLAEANERRNPQIFQDLYFELLSQYGAFLSDSRNALIDKRLFILDATVITLFNDILPAAGRKPSEGKRKGGVKVHALLNAATDVPDMVVFDSAASRDGNVLPKIRLPEKSIIVFDKGYVSHAQFDRLSNDGVTWVTRLTTSWVYEMTRLREVDDHQRANGILDDKEIVLGNQTNKKQKRVKARLITYFDGKHNRTFEFITNNTEMSAITIAQLYEKRWQVELVFKRLKQNCQLRYFLGESENAIKIQIWIAFIADLLTNVIQKKIKGRRYAFTTIATILRLHLMSYFKLIKFLDNPHKALNKKEAKVVEDLFSSA